MAKVFKVRKYDVYRASQGWYYRVPITSPLSDFAEYCGHGGIWRLSAGRVCDVLGSRMQLVARNVVFKDTYANSR